MQPHEQVAATVDALAARTIQKNPDKTVVIYLGEYEYNQLRRSHSGLMSWRVVDGQERYNGVPVFHVLRPYHLKVHAE